MRYVIGSIIGLLALFGLVGVAVTVSAIRAARAERRADERHAGGDTEGAVLSMRERAQRYVGPVDPGMALLNPPGRVAVECFTALCGFPGLGWILSGSVFTGILLITVVPAVVWGLYPVFLALTGRLLAGPFVAVQYLPGLALGSATMLAYREVKLARMRRRHPQVEAAEAKPR
jgi:hypothetical protein